MRVFLFLLALSFITGFLTASIGDQLQYPTGAVSAQKASPQNWIAQEQIRVYPDHVRIEIEGARWARFAPTGSMDPVLDQGAHGIQIVPQYPEQIAIGDIITYRHQGRSIIHRVVDIQYDVHGLYYTLKGDNNPEPDPVRVRFEDVERILVAIIY